MNDKLQKITESVYKANPDKPKIKMVCHVRGHEKSEEEPIRLADVLLAISSRGDADTPAPVWAIDTAGEFFDQSTSDGSPIYLAKYWNLLKDSLSDQSPETLQFIYELLK